MPLTPEQHVNVLKNRNGELRAELKELKDQVSNLQKGCTKWEAINVNLVAQNLKLAKLVKKLSKLERGISRYSHTLNNGVEVYTGEHWPDSKVEKLVKKAKKLIGE